MSSKKLDVVIIGSGFGASVAALRFAEAGYKVTVLERGGWISRENFKADDSMFWQPDKGRYGMHDFKKRGRHIIPWLGAGVGGGSHVYAATLKRRDFFTDFPGNITKEEMIPFYALGEQMMQAQKYPEYAPYNTLNSYCVFREAEQQLKKERPDIVESQGNILLAISFAPKGKSPGEVFTNSYGAQQRYADPKEQKLLGGGIDVKNTLDKNYLYLAIEKGANVRDFTEVFKIEQLPSKEYKVYWKDPRKDPSESGSITANILVCGAGAIGTTELLLQNKYIHKTLPELSESLGKNYFTNGDYVTFLVPKKGLLLSWIGLLIALMGWIFMNLWIALGGVLLYLIGWLISREKSNPDKGTTNSDYIRFKHRDGSTQGVYIEGGRYPTPLKALVAIGMSLTGNFKPKTYGSITKIYNKFGKFIPVLELVERSWPIPLLMMGRDDAVGSFHLNEDGIADIDFPFEANKEYIEHLNALGKLFAKKADSFFIPNSIANWFKIVEIPHNMGGVPMGNAKDDGVVDTYGRVFGYDNMMVLDCSILPNSLGPNPVNTILAFSERAMQKVVSQLEKKGIIRAL